MVPKETASKKPLILSLHIPYCIQPEKYQDRFFSVGSNEEKNAYLAALGKEILSYRDDLDDYEIRAVSVTGGSATVMSPDRNTVLAKLFIPAAFSAST